jgi:polyhydroxyalkanoate synthesis regulator phasin
MNSDTLVQLLQKGFRVTLGATASLIEVLQDPDKRDANLSKLGSELSQLAEEWAEKGEMTEQEARSFVDTILAKQANQATTETPSSSTTTATDAPAASPSVQLELQELTAQLAAFRAEFEKLRDPDAGA